MNKYVYKVIKWIEDPESVSQEERNKNKEEADLAAEIAVFYSAYYDDHYAYHAAYHAALNDPEEANHWVNSYFQETGENKQDYINKLNEE